VPEHGMGMGQGDIGYPLSGGGLSQGHHYLGAQCLELLQDPRPPGIHLLLLRLALQAAGHEVEKAGLLLLQAGRLQYGLAKEPPALSGQGQTPQDLNPVGRSGQEDRPGVLFYDGRQLCLEERCPLCPSRDDRRSPGPGVQDGQLPPGGELPPLTGLLHIEPGAALQGRLAVSPEILKTGEAGQSIRLLGSLPACACGRAAAGRWRQERKRVGDVGEGEGEDDREEEAGRSWGVIKPPPPLERHSSEQPAQACGAAWAS